MKVSKLNIKDVLHPIQEQINELSAIFDGTKIKQ